MAEPRGIPAYGLEGYDALYEIGLSAWIIQDANYPEFEVGQRVKFAVEYVPRGPVAKLPAGQVPSLRWRAPGLYEMRARGLGVWGDGRLVDAGSVVLFRDLGSVPIGVKEWPARTNRAGVWGVVELFVDPFDYFDGFAKISGIPPAIYEWHVKEIRRLSAPHVQLANMWSDWDRRRAKGVPVERTDAFNDAGGHAEYLLTVSRLSGPYLELQKRHRLS